MHERLFLNVDSDPAPRRALGPLAELVSDVLVYREDLPEAVVERVLPDGAVRLVFNLGDAPSAGSGTGHSVEAIGATAAPALVRLSGRIEGFSVALRPGAAHALLGVPAAELTGTAVHLDELWNGEASRVLERVVLAQNDAARVAVIEGALRARLRGNLGAVERSAARATLLIQRSAGRLSVRDVASQLGVGERRLQQLFRLHVGLSPRAVRRIARLTACLRALQRQARPGWAELALESGYYDQAHLANEFRALSGLSPSDFARQLPAVSASSKTDD